MTRKLFAGGLLLVVCLGLFLAGRASSQDPPQSVKISGPGAVAVIPERLAQLAQNLKNVRAQKAELDRREKQLEEQIAQMLQEARQQLDKKIAEERQGLDQIESLLHPEAKGGAMPAGRVVAGAMCLRSDRLKVLSTPAAPGQKGNQEMEAHGHIIVQAKEFSAQCDHMTYNEAKDQIIFVADPGNTATLVKFKGKGVQPDTLQGEKILYIRSTGKAEVIGNSLNGN